MSQKKREKLAKKGIVIRTKEEKRQIRRQKEKERKSKKKRKRGGAKEDDFETVKDQFKPGTPTCFNRKIWKFSWRRKIRSV